MAVRRYEVTVTWLDGKQATYRCYRSWQREGMLYLDDNPNHHRTGRRIPLVSVREWERDEIPLDDA